jgi:hypothetical protein
MNKERMGKIEGGEERFKKLTPPPFLEKIKRDSI